MMILNNIFNIKIKVIDGLPVDKAFIINEDNLFEDGKINLNSFVVIENILQKKGR